MKVVHWQDCEDVKMDKFPYKGQQNKVTGTSIRWLSKQGNDGHGYPEYGLRYFTIQPGGQIPIHNHFYNQTMYILSGRFECWQFDPQTDEMVNKEICGPGCAIYLTSMEPHGMKNISDEPGVFLCCICNLYGEEESL